MFKLHGFLCFLVVGYFQRNMSCDSSSEDEIFIGPVTAKERKLINKFKGRPTLVLEKNKPLYQRFVSDVFPIQDK